MPSTDMQADRQAGAGQLASSDVTPPNLDRTGQLEELLKGLKLEQIVTHADWLNCNSGDVQQRLIQAQYKSTKASSFIPRSVTASETSSKVMAVSVASISIAGSDFSSYGLSVEAPPSLVSHSTIGTGSLARTSLAGSLVPNLVLEEDVDGTLVRPDTPVQTYPCIFWFVKCQQHFNDPEPWDEHCKSHFGSPLPKTMHCPFHCDWQSTSETGEIAWQRRWIHIEEEHEMVGTVDVKSRPNKALLHHLWSTDVINKAQYKDIQKHGCLTEDSSTFVQSSRSEGRRRHRETRPLQRR